MRAPNGSFEAMRPTSMVGFAMPSGQDALGKARIHMPTASDCAELPTR